MTAQSFDHERLDVYRLSIDYVARSFEAAQSLDGLHRHARDQRLQGSGRCHDESDAVANRGDADSDTDEIRWCRRAGRSVG
jgi:hypothetical protein